MAKKKAKRLPSEILAAYDISVGDKLAAVENLLSLRSIGYELDFENFVEGIAQVAPVREGEVREYPSDVLNEYARNNGWSDEGKLTFALGYADDPGGMTIREFIDDYTVTAQVEAEGQADEPEAEGQADEPEAEGQAAESEAEDTIDCNEPSQVVSDDHPLVGKTVIYRPSEGREIRAVVLAVVGAPGGRVASLIDDTDEPWSNVDIGLLEEEVVVEVESIEAQDETKTPDFRSEIPIHRAELTRAKRWLDGKKLIKNIPPDEPLLQRDVEFEETDVRGRIEIINHTDGPYVDIFLYNPEETLAEHPPAYELERSFRVEHGGKTYEMAVIQAG